MQLYTIFRFKIFIYFQSFKIYTFFRFKNIYLFSKMFFFCSCKIQTFFYNKRNLLIAFTILLTNQLFFHLKLNYSYLINVKLICQQFGSLKTLLLKTFCHADLLMRNFTRNNLLLFAQQFKVSMTK